MIDLDIRCTPSELRTALEGGALEGYAVVYGSLSQDLGGFREIIEPGAFSEALAAAPDVRALYNHDPNMVLGRTTNGTLTLFEDTHGLRSRMVLPATQYATDVRQLVEGGYVNQMSFSFTPRKGGETWATENGQRVRRLRSLDLYDVSVVTYPAYLATTVASRTLTTIESQIQADLEIDRTETARHLAVAQALRQSITIQKLRS